MDNILSSGMGSTNNNFGIKNSFGINNNFGIKNNNGINLNNNNKKTNNTAYYAKKGEPMYMKQMDTDEDGVVSLDEFKEYCQANGISTDEMVRMMSLASSYRTMQAGEKASKNVQKTARKNSNDETTAKTAETEDRSNDAGVYAKRGDSKYDEVMDSNSDDKVTYKEYVEYCKTHAKQSEQTSDTEFEETESGEFKTKSASKAVNAYSQTESEAPEGKYEEEG